MLLLSLPDADSQPVSLPWPDVRFCGCSAGIWSYFPSQLPTCEQYATCYQISMYSCGVHSGDVGVSPVVVFRTCGLLGGAFGCVGRMGNWRYCPIYFALFLSVQQPGGIQIPWIGCCYASDPGLISSVTDSGMYPGCSPSGIWILFPGKTCSRSFHTVPMVCGVGGNGPTCPSGPPPKWRPQFTRRRGAPLVCLGQYWSLIPPSLRPHGRTGWWPLQRTLLSRHSQGRGYTPRRTTPPPPQIQIRSRYIGIM